MGKSIRTCFTPRPGNGFVEIDYGAMEFIIAACKWQDPRMMEYAADETKDIHSEKANDLFLLGDPAKTRKNKNVRFCGKTYFVFPILYGSDYINITKHLWEAIEKFDLKNNDNVPMREHLAAQGIEERGPCERNMPPQPGTLERQVKRVQDQFLAEFSTFKERSDKLHREYRKTGELRLMTGFRVGPGLLNKNQRLNTDIQGSAFHCILWSSIEMRKSIRKAKKRTLILANIHDCQLFDTPWDELQWTLTEAKDIMTNRIRKAWPWIVVPLKAEVDVVVPGGSWWDKKPWTERNGVWQPA